MKTVTALLAKHGTVVFPGIYDALSAHIAQQSGFDLAFVSGYAASATYLGMPDMGFLNQSDLVNIVTRCCAAAPDLSIIADADTGYGNEDNVRQTVARLIQAGAMGCFLEDQQWPKRCGHMQGKSIITVDEYASKIAAAKAEIGTADFFLVARTDAIAVAGLDDALARMHAAKDAGADGFFIEAPTDVAQMRELCSQAPKPLVANMIEGGTTPVLPQAELAEIGYSLILYPLTSLYATAKASQEALADLAAKGTSTGSPKLSFAQFNELINVPPSARGD